ncbi:hypothetical protein [Deinococcus marmoris]|uniref:Uncharacterized protein n=1 Tax=Deinococcus marmoris TaxID=249408 RepID=A0A1U7P4R1_9DEIO|nr:hypothetical protein [Deinococcus marmoris]OLV20165.1 hypothetical protein BOO71_0000523 [Deinococcus marmoris]
MNYPIYSTAPAPTALRARLRRANLRRRLSGPVMALALLICLLAVQSFSLPAFLLGAALACLGVRWSGQPISAWVDVGPLEWF